ncbi:hypothetical protein K439DRAFT_1518925 [Ramaria rubella]|nr:hypothetical protein K439DRAFT_1518925 [Ramaria rubella]
MHITHLQVPSAQPSQPKPPPKAKKAGPKKLALVSQLLNMMAPPAVPDWGPPHRIGGTVFSHPTLDKDNNTFFPELVLSINGGNDKFINDVTTDPSNSPPSLPSALPCINVPPPPHVDLTSCIVIPHLDLRKLPNKKKLSMPAGSMSCRSALAGKPDNEEALVVHTLSVTMRGYQGTNLIKLVPMSYHFNEADPCICPLIAQNLLEDGNLVYPKVYFDEHGAVQRSQWNREIILHKEPPFGHPILTQVVNTLAFQGHLPIASVALDLFNLIPLPLIALACTLEKPTFCLSLSSLKGCEKACAASRTASRKATREDKREDRREDRRKDRRATSAACCLLHPASNLAKAWREPQEMYHTTGNANTPMSLHCDAPRGAAAVAAPPIGSNVPYRQPHAHRNPTTCMTQTKYDRPHVDPYAVMSVRLCHISVTAFAVTIMHDGTPPQFDNTRPHEGAATAAALPWIPAGLYPPPHAPCSAAHAVLTATAQPLDACVNATIPASSSCNTPRHLDNLEPHGAPRHHPQPQWTAKTLEDWLGRRFKLQWYRDYEQWEWEWEWK